MREILSTATGFYKVLSPDFVLLLIIFSFLVETSPSFPCITTDAIDERINIVALDPEVVISSYMGPEGIAGAGLDV